jgi:ubiquinone/menaquinone biosynthesis C-methylase UbiE
MGPDATTSAPSADQTPAGWSDLAETYDAWLAPLTRRYADDVVRALELGPDRRLLDVGAGSGALALAAARAGASVLATDFAPGMVDLLRPRLAEEGLEAEVAEMDGQALDLPDASFDAAASLFGLIFFPDLAAGAAELRRVLHVGGRAAVAAWGPHGFALSSLAVEALLRIGVDQPGRTTLPAAFRLSDPARLEALLIDAGFSDVVVEQLEHAHPIADPAALFRAIPSWAPPLRPLIQRLSEDEVEAGAAAFADLVERRSGDDGLPISALLATGRR